MNGKWGKLAKICDRLYREQTVGDLPVYPERYSLDKIRKLKDPGSRYDSVVEVGKKHYHVGYNTAYSEYLEPAKLLLLKLIEDPSGDELYPKSYLRSVVDAITHNTWQKSEEVWLESFRKAKYPYVLYFGPGESVSDHALGLKRFFSFTALRVDRQKTELYKEWLTLLPDFYQQLPIKGSLPPGPITLVSGDMESWGGELKKLFAVGWSRPEDVRLIDEFGSIKQIFENHIRWKVDQLYLPACRMLLKDDQAEMLEHYLINEYVYAVVLHELCHTLGKFTGYREKLGSTYNRFEELRAESLAHILAGYLEDKGELPGGFSERMVLGELVVGSHMQLVYRETGLRHAYADIQAALVNILQNNIRESGGKYYLESLSKAAQQVRKLGVMCLSIAKRGAAREFAPLVNPKGLAEKMYLRLKYVKAPVEPVVRNGILRFWPF